MFFTSPVIHVALLIARPSAFPVGISLRSLDSGTTRAAVLEMLIQNQCFFFSFRCISFTIFSHSIQSKSCPCGCKYDTFFSKDVYIFGLRGVYSYAALSPIPIHRVVFLMSNTGLLGANVMFIYRTHFTLSHVKKQKNRKHICSLICTGTATKFTRLSALFTHVVSYLITRYVIYVSTKKFR